MWEKCVNAPQNFSPYIIAQLLQKVKRIWELLSWKKCWNLRFLQFRDNFRVISGISGTWNCPSPPPRGQPPAKVFDRPFFKKVAGFGAAPRNTPFFWFFFCGYLLKKRTEEIILSVIPRVRRGDHWSPVPVRWDVMWENPLRSFWASSCKKGRPLNLPLLFWPIYIPDFWSARPVPWQRSRPYYPRHIAHADLSEWPICPAYQTP